MLPESCVLDSSQPCHACSAAGPDGCPYLYLLGWTAQPVAPDLASTPPRPAAAPGPAPAGAAGEQGPG